MASLITSGLLDDFPRLRFIVEEMGTGHIKPLAERLDAPFRQATSNFEAAAGESGRGRNPRLLVDPEVARPKNKRAPSDYLRTNFWWSIETEEPELVEAIEYMGADRFLFATDYPHDDPGGCMKFKDVELLRENPAISEAHKELIRWKNAVQLFDLE
jgi:predicted TIM-barrel fold metal-dependent hydrolase